MALCGQVHENARAHVCVHACVQPVGSDVDGGRQSREVPPNHLQYGLSVSVVPGWPSLSRPITSILTFRPPPAPLAGPGWGQEGFHMSTYLKGTVYKGFIQVNDHTDPSLIFLRHLWE